MREPSVVADVTGMKNAALSRTVNSILDHEGASQPIWYRDVDYVDFVIWHENRWRGDSSGLP